MSATPSAGPTRTVVAMSGGVDSSVAAALLVDAGHDVIGLSMQLYDQREGDERFGGCCTLDDLRDAKRVARRLGIPHYIVNFAPQFEAHVISNFTAEYLAGRTPIPCTRCNSEVKFATLLDRAEGLNAPLLATGHYARLTFDAGSGRYRLWRGADRAKDQSYFLFGLTQAQLARASFPVGDLDKRAVRRLAADLELSVAEKPDSHELCFVPDGDHAGFIERHTGVRPEPGPVVDPDGRVLGAHGGLHRYTVGQRKGLGLSSPTPLYVIALDPALNTVIVGGRTDLDRHELTASRVNWIAGVAPAGEVAVTARIRHRQAERAARVRTIAPDRVAVRFENPQQAVAPGQAVVFYEGEEVLGGGWIDSADTVTRPT